MNEETKKLLLAAYKLLKHSSMSSSIVVIEGMQVFYDGDLREFSDIMARIEADTYIIGLCTCGNGVLLDGMVIKCDACNKEIEK